MLKMYLDHLHHHTLSFSFLLLPFFVTLSSPLFSFYLHLSLFLFFFPFLLLPFFLSFSPLLTVFVTSTSLNVNSSFPSSFFLPLSLSSLHCFCYLYISLCQFFFSSFLLFFSVDSSLWKDVKSYDEKIQIDTVLPFKDFSVISGREDGLPRIWLLTPGVRFILYFTTLYYIILYYI